MSTHKVSRGVALEEIKYLSNLFPIYILVIASLLFCGIFGSRVATVIAEKAPIANRKCIIIDAGHGGIDGGAVSCTGAYESQINLEIALKLNDLCHLLGYRTKMIRTTDCSIYTQGSTIAAKKVSDLKERVRITNETENAVLISIHQNIFSQSQYHGAQVFYAKTTDSNVFAKYLQDTFIESLNPDSDRKIKKADNVYLMQHITCPAVLVECGFLSNPQEEAFLRDPIYQKKICCVIVSAYSKYLKTNTNSLA